MLRIYFFLACASLAKPLNCLAVSAVESPEATVEFRQRTLVDNVGHRLDAATGAEWLRIYIYILAEVTTLGSNASCMGLRDRQVFWSNEMGSMNPNETR